jgi:hypothetical protein
MGRWLLRLWADPTYGLLLRVGIGQVLVLGGVLLSVVGLRLRRRRGEARRRGSVARAEAAVLGLLAGELTEAEAALRLRRLPRGDLCEILERYAGALGGESRASLQGVYGALGLQRHALGLLRSRLWWRRLEGVRLLAAMGGDAGQGELVARLWDRSGEVRLAAARAVARRQALEALPTLLEALSSASRLSRRQVAEALVEFGASAWPALREALRTPPQGAGGLRLHATMLEVLALSGDWQAAGVIEAALSDPEVELRAAGFKAAILLHLNLSAERLRAGLRDPRWEVRALAARACGHAGQEALVQDLGVALSQEEWWVRFNAARALARLGGAGRRELERVAYQSVDGYARDAALQVLTEDPAYAELYAYRRQVGGEDGEVMLEEALLGAAGEEGAR